MDEIGSVAEAIVCATSEDLLCVVVIVDATVVSIVVADVIVVAVVIVVIVSAVDEDKAVDEDRGADGSADGGNTDAEVAVGKPMDEVTATGI